MIGSVAECDHYGGWFRLSSTDSSIGIHEFKFSSIVSVHVFSLNNSRCVFQSVFSSVLGD